jgi:CheY-like chemotaxis protein/HPt (histidine-containing phosphotransfer) domain-containing protein
MRHQLGILGFRATMVDDAERGLEILARESCDVVLLDCELPQMDGYTAAREIRRRDSKSRPAIIIALTAHTGEGARERCIGAGMDDYLSKPVKLAVLGETIDRWTHQPPDRELPSCTVTADEQVAELIEKGIDPSRLMDIAHLAKPNDPVVRQIVSEFLDDLSARIVSINHAVESSNWSALADLAHPLRSAAAIVGAKRFSAMCTELETLSRANRTREARYAAGNVVEEAQKLPACSNKRWPRSESPDPKFCGLPTQKC